MLIKTKSFRAIEKKDEVEVCSWNEKKWCCNQEAIATNVKKAQNEMKLWQEKSIINRRPTRSYPTMMIQITHLQMEKNK